ncbi:MAG: M23 family metallopeptidase [Candidatus Thorarchaeota archaeon]|nr:M23 family metallopeptidase [Candidatus Thorarchaeota archaeon]
MARTFRIPFGHSNYYVAPVLTRNMMKKYTIFSLLLLIIGASIIGLGNLPDTPSPLLEFPIQQPDSIERLAAYHTPDWGEPGVYHNGIDLVVSENVTVISPCEGKIASVSESVNPYAGNVLFSVVITIDRVWEVKLVLEPGFTDSSNNSKQTDAITIEVGESVAAGATIATLLHSDHYPHLHYMLLYRGVDVSAYDFSSPSAKATFEEIATRSNSTIQYDYDLPKFTETLQWRIMTGGGGSLIILGLVVFIVRRRR